MDYQRPHYIFVCANSYQMGWLQLREAGKALYERGARPVHARQGIWQLPNGKLIQFASVQDDIWRALYSIAPDGDVLLLYEDKDLDDETNWYVYELLKRMQAERNIHITSMHQTRPQLESWRAEAVNLVLPIDEQDTQPLELIPPIAQP